MIVGFLGKGGSGKSTLSSAFVRYLAKKGKKVLAIDADHNMDLTFNLGVGEKFPYLGEGIKDIKEHVGISTQDESSKAFSLEPEPEFSLTPADPYTKKFSLKLNDNISLMAGGPHTDDVLYGQSCSHILTTALKIYLPFLKLNKNEVVVIDEKAGSDGAGTGIVSGFTMAVIAAEPTPHGVKAANQIADLLDFHNTPYEFAINKIRKNIDLTATQTSLKKPAELMFPFTEDALQTNGDLPPDFEKQFDEIYQTAVKIIETDGDIRKERSRKKYERSKAFKEHAH